MAAPPTNILSTANLTRIMLASLPKSSEPQIRNPWDAVSLLCHACMLAVDFRLIGLGEDYRIETSSYPSSPSPLPSEWNTLSSSDYAFRYSHSQSSMQYLLKVSKLGSKAVINGLGIGHDKVASFDIPVKDFVSQSNLPYTTPQNNDDPSDETLKPLEDVFISAGRIGDFSALVKIQLLQKLIPGLHKEGYQETAAAASERVHAAEREREQTQREDIAERERQPPRDPQNPQPPAAMPRPFHDPLAAPPRRPYVGPDFEPPGFEDEHGVLRPPGRGGAFPGGGPGMPNLGDRDLYPQGMGPNDPLRIGGPRGGFRGGGGMHPTFDDPMFGGRGGEDNGYNPRAPPGARIYPVSPEDDPYDTLHGGGPPQGNIGGRPGGGFGGPPNPFGGFGRDDFI